MDSDGFLRDELLDEEDTDPFNYSHYPIIATDSSMPLGEVIKKLYKNSQHPEDDVIDKDIILLWVDRKRIITGADILGRLLRGISRDKAQEKNKK